jgi:hypothetical protein
MTDIRAKALALVREVQAERDLSDKRAVRREVSPHTEALCRAIEQHEAFKQKMSDIVYAHVNATNETSADAWEKLKTLIIPAPKPDPLVDVAESLGYFNTAAQGWAGDVRAALEARGLEIREKGQ